MSDGGARTRTGSRPLRTGVVLGLGLALVTGLASPTLAAATPAGPGRIAISTASTAAGLTVELTYVPEGGPLAGGVVAVAIPRGWTAPQKRAAGRAGYVTVSAGRLRIFRRIVRVSRLALCARCTLHISYADAKAVGGRSTFTTRTSRSARARRRPVSVQPTVTVKSTEPAALLTSAPTSARAIPLGDYAGWADPAGVAAFGRATGTHPVLALDYLDRSDGWAGMEDAAGMGRWAGSGYRLVLGVPIIPTGPEGTPRGTLAQGATGAYDGHFTTLARNLVRDGLANAVLRLGWEYNGNWFAWSVHTGSQAASFAAYWRRIVATMRAVPGQRFAFFWNPNALSPTAYAPAAAYPGNAYVTFVGTDAYDNDWAKPFTPSGAWNDQLTTQYGLDWLASFAASHRKRIAIGEWGPSYRSDGHGLGDDPYYVDHVAAWIVVHRAAFSDIFSFDTSNQHDNILDGSFPRALAAFRQAFG